MRRLLVVLAGCGARTPPGPAASDVELLSCTYEVPGSSGEASITRIGGVVVEVHVATHFPREDGALGYSCLLDARSSPETTWSRSGAIDTVAFHGDAAGDVLRVVRDDDGGVHVDLSGVASTTWCGAGAALPSSVEVAPGSPTCGGALGEVP